MSTSELLIQRDKMTPKECDECLKIFINKVGNKKAKELIIERRKK